MEEITPPGEKPKSKQTKAQEDEEDEEAKEEKKRRRSLRYYDAFPDCGESFPDEHKVLLLAHSWIRTSKRFLEIREWNSTRA